jgi:hypothetical protein
MGLGNRDLRLRFEKGTNIEVAREVANALNKSVKAFEVK